ncbi:MAG: hypothetical protein WCC29_19325 [Pseudomonas farsensis]|uniref:hypothetical protein n=1 Tax=Pseudomonas farsensis TaxID=2745492 RepID=UPI003C7DC25B
MDPQVVDPDVDTEVDPDVDTEVDPEVVDPEIVDPPEVVDPEVVDPEVVDPEVVDPVDPEIKPEPQGPIDPDGPLGNLRETGRMGPPLTNEQHDAFGLVQESVYSVLMEVLPKHGLDATGHWLISNTDDASDRLPVDIYLTWAVITGNLETSDQLHYGFYGESIMRDEGNFAAALDEAFAQMLAMDIIA